MAGMPAYHSVVQPRSEPEGRSSFWRNDGPHTWAPMSPPVGVAAEKIPTGSSHRKTATQLATTTAASTHAASAAPLREGRMVSAATSAG